MLDTSIPDAQERRMTSAYTPNLDKNKSEYLILGSGLSGLSFGALMANRGKDVCVLEAHELFGGYGHTFQYDKYEFNAQLHYVMSCGKGQWVRVFYDKLGLEDEVQFEALDPDGYDRIYCEDRVLKIPNSFDQLAIRLKEIDSTAGKSVDKFMSILRDISMVNDNAPRHVGQINCIVRRMPAYARLAPYFYLTLQQVFDRCGLPKLLQTMVSGQLIDLMLPPKDIAFIAWAWLFTEYTRGAYYPKDHFRRPVEALITKIRNNGGDLIANRQVTEFIFDKKRIIGVKVQEVEPKNGSLLGKVTEYYGDKIICNFDPKTAAQMIGMKHFSPLMRYKLTYDYSYSNFVVYAAVKDLDLAEHGFGKWNIWHCHHDDLNLMFDDMYLRQDYSRPNFAMNCRTLHTDIAGGCPEGEQIFQICTVANYNAFKNLRLRDPRAYQSKKNGIMKQLLGIVEEKYVPDLKKHLSFAMAGTPVSNERYCWAPQGNSYGCNWTPENLLMKKITSKTGLENFYFCNATSGMGGFNGTILNGIRLYEDLTGDYLDF